MSRFWGLFCNELAKLRTRWVIRLGVLALALTALGLSAAQWLSVRSLPETEDPIAESTRLLYEQLQTLEEEQPEDLELQREILLFLLDNRISIIDNNWRLAAVQKLSDDIRFRDGLLEDPALREKAAQMTAGIRQDRALIEARDYRGYYQKRLEDTRKDTSLREPQRERLLWRYQYILDNQVAAEGAEWKYNLMTGLVAAMSELEEQQALTAQGGGVNRAYEQRLEAGIAIARYRIEHELETVAGESISGFYYEEPSRYWQLMETSASAVLPLALFVILLAGSSVSGEFAGGTAGALLAVPARRGKVLGAKYLSVLAWAAFLLIGFYLASILAGGLFFGFGDAGASYLSVQNGVVREMSGYRMLAEEYLLAGLPLLVYGTAAFSMSALLRNTAAAVGVNAFLLLAGPYLVSWLHYTLNQDWARYLLFANLDLGGIRSGANAFPGQTVPFALLISGVHLLVFLLTAWDAFVYRDVR